MIYGELFRFNGGNDTSKIWGEPYADKIQAQIKAKLIATHIENLDFIPPEKRFYSIIKHDDSFSTVIVELKSTSIKTKEVADFLSYWQAYNDAKEFTNGRIPFRPNFFFDFDIKCLKQK